MDGLLLWLAAAACSGGPTVAPVETSVSPPPPVRREPAAAAEQEREPDASSDRGVVFDEVLAIVGSEVVTKSSIRAALELELDKLRRRNPGKKIPPAILEEVERRLVQRRVSEFLLADHVETLSIDQDRLKQYIEGELAAVVKQREEEAGGSSLDLLRALREKHKSYAQFLEEERAKIRRRIVMATEWRKSHGNSPLLATPAELLAYYESHPEEFAIPATAEIALLRFEDAAGLEPAAARAAEARARLAKGEAPEAVAKELSGTSETLTLTPDDNRPAALRSFAFGGPPAAGRVSTPIRAGSEVQVLQLRSRREAGTEPFVDADVQERIRAKISDRRWDEAMRKIDREERRRIQYWPRDLFRR